MTGSLLWLSAGLTPHLLGLGGMACLALGWASERVMRRKAEQRLRANIAERDAEIRTLGTFIDQQQASHIAAAEEWADRCRAANAVAIALDPYTIERTS